MRIDPRSPAPSAAVTPARTARAGDARFGLGGADAATSAASARSAATVASLDLILALQGEEDPAEKRRRGARRGRNLLDALDGLKADLLGGRVPAATLGRIAADLAQLERSGDPGLDDVLAQIELRARVELAKLGRA